MRVHGRGRERRAEEAASQQQEQKQEFCALKAPPSGSRGPLTSLPHRGTRKEPDLGSEISNTFSGALTETLKIPFSEIKQGKDQRPAQVTKAFRRVRSSRKWAFPAGGCLSHSQKKGFDKESWARPLPALNTPDEGLPTVSSSLGSLQYFQGS